ncbi:MAG TPA: hypothetical protein VLQ90_12375, partial [Pyrinomonadaceae bacterium]|nr:hypothetical protein [Pyrinomonadaceae bacterium]
PSRNFALALMDLVLPGQTAQASGATNATPPPPPDVTLSSPPLPPLPPTDPHSPLYALRNAIDTAAVLNGNDRVKRTLRSMIDAAGNDVSKARDNIEAWFNSGMDRVSGWYKRRSQTVIFFLGLAIAIAINADSLLIVRALSTNKPLRESMVSAAQDYARNNASSTPKATPSSTAPPSPSPAPSPAKTSPTGSSTPAPPACKEDPNSPQCAFEKNLDIIKNNMQKVGLPIGWVEGGNDIRREWPGNNWTSYGGWWSQIGWHWMGWLMTALALSMGAPFWFDLLNKFIVVRSTVKPKEKSPDEPSKS